METQLDRIERKLDLLLAKKKTVKRIKPESTSLFDDFWQAYPRKQGKLDALKAFNAATSKLGTTYADAFVVKLICDITNRTGTDSQWQNKQYIPLAATYIRGEKWNDEITPVASKAPAIPLGDNDLEAWAISHGHRHPLPGEQFHEYRNYLQGKL